MDRQTFLRSYHLHNPTIGSWQTYEKLGSIFKEILNKRSSYKKGTTFSYFSKEIEKSITEPLDYQCPTMNQKEVCIRFIYHFLSKNKLIDALHGLLYLIHNFTINNSFVWRTGFHILIRIGDQNSMNEFFDAMLENNVWDISNMYYEYMLFLMEKKEFSRVIELYHNSFSKGLRYKRVMREPEADEVHQLIKLLLAVASYGLWKKSLFSGEDDDGLRLQAELQFQELEAAIRKKMIVDSCLLNYIDLLEHTNKLDKALEILELYREFCSNNIHSLQYLLDFMIRNRRCLPQITDEIVAELRSTFVLRQLQINPTSSDFVIRCFKEHVEYLDETGDHENCAKLLLDYLCDSRWEPIDWPWGYLVRSIQNLGESNPVVQESWIYIRHSWMRKYFQCPRNNHILALSRILK